MSSRRRSASVASNTRRQEIDERTVAAVRAALGDAAYEAAFAAGRAAEAGGETTAPLG